MTGVPGAPYGPRTMWHPWRALRNLPWIDIVWTPLPGSTAAVTDGHTIWIDPRLTQAQRRSTIEHERQHVLAGHGTACTPALERRVEQAAARQLITLDRLVDALVWARDEHELADELWVDVDMARARLAGLTEQERAFVIERLEARGA